ncbi:hypothetical protein U0L90_09735 [Flavobacteriaceae sp. LMIT009]
MAKKKKAFVPIGNFRWIKRSSHIPRKSVMPIYKKLRLKDIINWNNQYVRIDIMIDKHPIDLWNMIYNKENGKNSISLDKRSLELLKSRVSELKPELIEALNNKKKHHKDIKKLKQKLKDGKNVSQVGRFKKIRSERIIE